jgi:hypothetical protein
MGLDVDRYIIDKRSESRKKMIGSLDHEVRIQRDGRDFGDRFHHRWSKRDIVDKMPIHHVEMQPIRASFFYPFALRFEIVEITGEY